MLTSSVICDVIGLLETRNVKKPKILIKIVNTNEENLQIFRTALGI